LDRLALAVARHKEAAMQARPADSEAADRIAAPWGARTPHGPGEAWPRRVDTFLDDRVTPEQVDR
jgi:hypothetical protein